MGLKNISKIVLSVVWIVLATSCLEKTDTLSTENKDTANTNSLWQWNDQQKDWLYNGSVLSPRTTHAAASVWKKKENAILFRVESPKSLTVFDNAPKALQLKIFQLSDSKAFLRAAKSSSGLKHLLITEHIDPAIVGIERLIVLPGVSQSMSLDRQEGARYIGIVLGYANLKQEKIFRLIPIVTIEDSHSAEETAGDSPLLASLSNSQPEVKPTPVPGHPATLKINLQLEASGISKLEVDAR